MDRLDVWRDHFFDDMADMDSAYTGSLWAEFRKYG